MVSENKTEVEPDKVLTYVSSSIGQFQTAGSWKFQSEWCKELTYPKFNHSMGSASFKASPFPIAYCRSEF
jgi:hypothetical protein